MYFHFIFFTLYMFVVNLCEYIFFIYIFFQIKYWLHAFQFSRSCRHNKTMNGETSSRSRNSWEEAQTIGFSSSMNLLILTTLRTWYLIIVSIMNQVWFNLIFGHLNLYMGITVIIFTRPAFFSFLSSFTTVIIKQFRSISIFQLSQFCWN